MKPRALTERQRRFVEAYMAAPNASRAHEAAGYKGSRRTHEVEGAKLLRKPEVQAALQERVRDDPKVAERKEIMEWWTGIVRGDGVPAAVEDRLRASSLLAKAQGMFVQRVEVTTPPRTDLSLYTDAELAGLRRIHEAAAARAKVQDEPEG